MKKARIMLGVIFIVACTGAALAFKAHKGVITVYLTCNQETQDCYYGGYVMNAKPTIDFYIATRTIAYATSNLNALNKPCNEYCPDNLYLMPAE
jgi:hypothetical protein